MAPRIRLKVEPREQKTLLLLTAISLISVALTWWVAFPIEDAFISFLYARNLVEGHGLVWQPGDRVLGITNLGWTLMIAPSFWLGIKPWILARLLASASLVALIFGTYALGRRVMARGPAIGAAILVAFNPTVIRYAGSGLETVCQAALAVVALWLAARRLRPDTSTEIRLREEWALGLVLAVAIVLRMDGGLIAAVCVGGLSLRIWRGAGPIPEKLKELARLWTLPALASLALLAWQWWYYGNPLPNTFYAKAGNNDSTVVGLSHLYLYLLEYGVIFVFIMIAAARRTLRERATPAIYLTGAFAALWVAYLISVGGDYMQFRMYIPTMAPFAIVGVWAFCELSRSTALRRAALIFLCVMELHHGVTFKNTHGIEGLEQTYFDPFTRIGKVLGSSFRDGEEVLIATTAAGKIPYYSSLRFVDMFGLNDAWVARHGFALGNKPGHQRLATWDYLRRREVDLIMVVTNSTVVPEDAALSPAEWKLLTLSMMDDLETLREMNPRILEIPLPPAHKIRAIYVGQSDALDRVIEREGWKVAPFPETAP
jgi:arabinofuranosyltransferase